MNTDQTNTELAPSRTQRHQEKTGKAFSQGWHAARTDGDAAVNPFDERCNYSEWSAWEKGKAQYQK